MHYLSKWFKSSVSLNFIATRVILVSKALAHNLLMTKAKHCQRIAFARGHQVPLRFRYTNLAIVLSSTNDWSIEPQMPP